MKNMTFLNAIVEEERQRFLGANGDTLIIDTYTQDGALMPVKVKEAMTTISPGAHLAFFGKMGTYRKAKQFHAAFYVPCDADVVQSVIDTVELTEGRKFPREIARYAYEKWETRAPDIVRRKPHSLMQFPRVGFKIADDLYIALGHPPGKLRRQLLCGLYALETSRDGSVWHLRQVFEDAIRASIMGAEPLPEKAMRLGIRANKLATRYTDGPEGPLDPFGGSVQWVASERDARAEKNIAQLVADALNEKCRWPAFDAYGMSAHQLNELNKATARNIGLLMGGGGTGKTYVISELIKQLPAKLENVLLCAPTGRAAVRLTEEARQNGLEMTAKTIHSVLEWSPDGFRRHAGNPLEAEFIIVDETSMVDQSLMRHLLSARPDGCPILFVGDPYQLPPVQRGAPFRDFQEVLPSGTLTETRRNCGQIAWVAQQIRNDEPWSSSSQLRSIDLENKEFPYNHIHIDAKDSMQQIGYLHSVIEYWQEMGYDHWDIQVMCVVNKHSEVSVERLNGILQQRFNGKSEEIPGSPFRRGDKLMNTSNGWLIPAPTLDGEPAYEETAIVDKGGRIYVANGEFGQLVDVRNKYFVVRMASPYRLVRVNRLFVEEGSEEGQTGTDFTLGYAITTHKSQGSQFPITICMVDNGGGAGQLADRALYYTMLTRSTEACVSIGSKRTLEWACRKNKINDRKTFLVELMKGAISKSNE